MWEHLEHRTLLSYPPGPYWNPGIDDVPGRMIYRFSMHEPQDFTATGVTAAWDVDPNAAMPAGGGTLTLSNMPPHSEIKVIAEVDRIVQNPQQGTDTTPDGGCIRLNGVEVASANYAEGSGADINTGYQGNGGSTVTVNVGPKGVEPDEPTSFGDVQVWIWTPTITLQHPLSLNEGQSGHVLIMRTGGDHGIFPIPVNLAKVQVFGPNQATDDDWTLETNKTIPAGPPSTSVLAAIYIVDDPTFEQQESANYRVLPSNIHTAGGTTGAPTGNRTLTINASDHNPYGGGGGGFGSQGAFSDDLISSEDDDEYTGELVESVPGDLVGDIIA